MKEKIKNIFYKFSRSEAQFFGSQTHFFSPVVQGQPVRVRLDGIVMTFRVLYKNIEDHGIFNGYCVLRPINHKEAEIVRRASLSEQEEYLKIFPRFSAVVYRMGKQPRAVLSNAKHENVELNGNIEILLSQDISLFDVVDIRWDGTSFWYEGHSAKLNLNQGKLQEALNNKTEIKNLSIPHISPAECSAYSLALDEVKDKVEDRLNKALLRSGGKLVRYTDRGASYTVTYKVEDREITSTVNAENLQVQSAGICLSGSDSLFDLQTLVHKIREGENRGKIVVGDFSNYPGHAGEDEDW